MPCKKGSFNAQHGAIGCIKCPPEKFAGKDGASNCDSCSGGFVNLDRTMCSRCKPGTTPNYSTRECDPCPLGHFSGDSSQPCQACERGTFAPSTGMVACEHCPAFTYQDTVAALRCKDCSPGEASTNNGTSCEMSAVSLVKFLRHKNPIFSNTTASMWFAVLCFMFATQGFMYVLQIVLYLL